MGKNHVCVSKLALNYARSSERKREINKIQMKDKEKYSVHMVIRIQNRQMR
jgi:hypothetical protein